jgi:integrase/recombinase XerD
MERRQNVPDLRRLPFLGPHSQQLVTAYLAFLTARHYARSTIQTTIDTLKSFCVLVPATRRPCLLQDLTRTTPEDVDAWLQAAHHKGLAPSTINNIVGALHRFFAFLCEQGWLSQSPIDWRRHRVLAPQPLPKPIAEEDLRAFFKVIDALPDRLIFLLMLRCGLRVGEVSTLTWPAIDRAARSLRIDNSKGLVDRVVYFSPDVEKALGQWRHLQLMPAGYVFPSPWKATAPLSVRCIQVRMARYLHLAHVTKPYSPHSLRHTFATQLLNAGAPLEVVKELMGHRAVMMTLRYTQLYETTKRDQYYQAMARLEKGHALPEG